MNFFLKGTVVETPYTFPSALASANRFLNLPAQSPWIGKTIDQQTQVADKLNSLFEDLPGIDSSNYLTLATNDVNAANKLLQAPTSTSLGACLDEWSKDVSSR